RACCRDGSWAKATLGTASGSFWMTWWSKKDSTASSTAFDRSHHREILHEVDHLILLGLPLSVSFSADGTRLLTAASMGSSEVFVWDAPIPAHMVELVGQCSSRETLGGRLAGTTNKAGPSAGH